MSAVDDAIARWRAALPEELFELRVFLLWQKKPKPGKPGKFDKVPHYASGGKRYGINGSDEDRARLVDFGDAIVAFKRSRCDGIGAAVLPDVPFWPLDLDGCIDETFSPLAQRVVASGAYCERSPSGRGVRALFAGKAGVDAKNHDAGVEIFNSRGFVTLTGDRIGGDRLLPCPQQLLSEILDIVRVGSKSCGPRTFAATPPEPRELPNGAGLPPRILRRLVNPYPHGCDRSSVALALALDLRRLGRTREEVFALMCIPEVLVPALERREGDIDSARDWMWLYVVLPAFTKPGFE